MQPDYDPQKFYAGLVEHGYVFPVGVQGAFGRGDVFEDILERFNELVTQVASDDGAETRTFPPIVNRKVIERNNYLESFPHLCGAVFSFSGKELQAREMAQKAAAGEPWNEYVQMTDVCLTPAICYPLYPTLKGTLPEGGRLFSMLGWAYRHEPSPEPTRMQSFRMREFIRAGTADDVVQWRDMWLERGLRLLRDLGLNANPDVASDPFFGRGGKMMAANQKEQRLKFEVLVPVISEENPTAVCSFNFHQDHFGSKWDIRTADGNVANTACLGFGLERVVMALIKTHGFDVNSWPVSVRKRLWPRTLRANDHSERDAKLG
jgi:seryl-tRNA synthetase